MQVERVQLLLENALVDMGWENGAWRYDDVILTVGESGTVAIRADWTPVCKVRLTFERKKIDQPKVLGDTWERAYADMEWRAPDGNRKMPWYFFAWEGQKNHCFGIKTGPNSLCYWLYDGLEASLTIDLRSGTDAVQLKGRELTACTIVTAVLEGDLHESCAAFCRMMCDNPRIVDRPIFGGNDWYCNYGDNSYEKIKVHAQRVVECAQDCPYLPFMVIDDGWQLCHNARGSGYNGGPWGYANSNFGDMKAMAEEIDAAGAIPGIWFRPLETMEQVPESWLLKRDFDNVTLDPSVPEVLDLVKRDVKTIVSWGYKLIKHDFSSADIFGKWGFQMDDDLHYGQTHFADRSRTTAEIMKDFYMAIREAAADEVLIMGCNTFSHLSAGIMDIQRTGDDTSGREWDRTKNYGINTLAFRMMQHNAFYSVDADCVGITNNVPWEKNRQWLDVLAKSGTPLFVSIAQDAYHDHVRKAVRMAFEAVCATTEVSRPVDWLESRIPCVWESVHGTDRYEW